MKLLFAHDHIFYKFEEKVYSTGGLSAKMLEKYTNSFDKVTVISRQKSTIDVSKLTLASTERVEFVKIPDFKSPKKYISNIVSAKIKIKNEVKNVDYVIARLPSSIGNLAIKYAIQYQKPYLIEVVSCPWDAYWNRSLVGKLIAPFAYYSMKNRVYHSKYTIYVTNEFLQKRYPTVGQYTNCSNVSLTDFDESILERRIVKIKNKSTDKVVMGTVGAIDVSHKGQEYVIKLLSKLKKEGREDIHYQLVGGGSKQRLEALVRKYNVENQVFFLGTLPHNEIFEWLETIDLYIQPSKQEGLPRALIEAMSKAVPSIGANVAGIPELLSEQYIFNHGKNYITEIENIIKKTDGRNMIEQARLNFNISKEYEKEIIEERRNLFFGKFIANN
ncbi:MAG: glycosyltransferase [Culicoidibacterales bacterium]